MKRIYGVLFALFLFAAPASAQTDVTGSEKLAWDQAATTLAVAQGYSYRLYIDNAAAGVVVTPVTCSGTATPFVCQAAFPALTPGTHTLQISAAVTVNGQLVESAKSAAFSVRVVVAPSTPANLRIQ